MSLNPSEAITRGVRRPFLMVGLLAAATIGTTTYAAGPELTFSSGKVEFRNDIKNKGKKWLKFTLDALVNTKLTKDSELSGKASCQVGPKKMTDKMHSRVGWADIEQGETKSVELRAFDNHNLEATPESCEFSIKLGAVFGKDEKEIAKFCWTTDGVKDGACP